MGIKYILHNFLIALFVFFIISCKNNTNEDKHISTETTKDSITDPLKLITQKIANDSLNADLYNERSYLYIQKKLINESLNDIHKALELKPSEVRYYMTLSDIYMLMGKMQKSINTLKKASDLNSEDPAPYLKIAEIYLINKEYPLCFDYIEKAIALDAVNPRAYFMRGFANKERGDTVRAVKFFQIAIDQDQDYYEAYNQLGLLFAAKGSDMAIDYYNNALDIKPNSIEIRYNLAMYYQDDADYSAAINTYLSIIDIDSLYKNAFFNLGYIYLVYLEVYETAIDYFTNAIEVHPEYIEAYYNRGYCYELLGRNKEAESDYRKCLDLETNYEKAVEGLNRLDKR
ncbi:MAG: tetratricopeptide repeat protein [Bacteroidales bacterium]|nr:tetratricopeptide repeat protein [Bacteroidales bacterium]